MERVFHPVAVHFKGSGFYTTDYGRGRSGAGAGASSDSSGESSGDSSGDSSKSDSSKGEGRRAIRGRVGFRLGRRQEHAGQVGVEERLARSPAAPS